MPTRQIGISPKVAIPTTLIAIVGVVLLVIGLASSDEALRSAGIAALGAAGVGGTTGYAVPAGAVAHEQPASASDDLLSSDAEAQIHAIPPPTT